MKNLITFEDFVSEEYSINEENDLKESVSSKDRKNITDLYKKGKSQSEIADELKLDIWKVVIPVTNKLPHYTARQKEEEERLMDDPSSKQYYDRILNNKSKK